MIIFSVDNDRVSIAGADHQFLKILGNELKYPSAIASCLETGIELPLETPWDGWIRLLHTPKTIPPWFPTGLISLATFVMERAGYHIQVNDLRVRPDTDIPELVDIPLRDYQQEAVEAAYSAGRGVIDAVPRSGKTRLMCELTRRIALPVIWIAPTDRIVRQTVETLHGFFGDNYALHLIGSNNLDVASFYKIIVCTAATAVLLDQQFYDSRKCLIVDEFHHSSAKSYKDIFSKCKHIYYRFGMTGTFFRSGEDGMAMQALLSNVVYKITSDELLRRGFLVPAYVAFIPFETQKLRGVDSNFISGCGKYGIHEHVHRNQLIAYTAMYLQESGRKCLILVGTKKQGNILKKILNSFLVRAPAGAEFESAEFVSTDMKRSVQTRVLQSFEEGQEVKVLIGTSLLGEGVDLPSTDSLILARGEKASVSLTQAMYRVCTASEGKSHAIVVDFADRHHRILLKHSKERAAVYMGDPIFGVTVLGGPRQFPEWLMMLSEQFKEGTPCI